MEEASSIAKAIETAWNRAGQPTEFSVKVLELPQTSFFGLKTSKSAKVAFFFNEATVTVKVKESAPQQRHAQQRPVTLRQHGNKSESSDQQRRPQHPRYDNRGSQSQEGREPSDYTKNADRHDTRQPREQREPSDYNKSSADRRENRGFEQRQDQRNRPQGPRRTDDRQRRPDFNKPDRHEDRRPRHDGERTEHGHSQERETWSPEMVQVAQEWIKETLVLMGKPDITVNTQVSHNYLKINLSASVLEDARQEETQLKSWGMLAMEAVREKAGRPLRSLRIILESK